ncbi:MAG: hypothetical protein GQ562_08695, partial [Anaerolineales bacterium]|nr:hypothetical protein [Anaerolineales bacterium]
MRRTKIPIMESNKTDPVRKKTGKISVFKFLIILPVIIYLPGILGWIPFPSETAQYTDLLLAHYPNAVYLRDAILQDHSIPLWSNLIYSGVPFAANPLSGVWYLPGWIALIFPLPAGISIVLAMHSVFGTWGFYKLLRSEGAGDIGSIIGGIAFGLMPKIAAHYGAGHVTMLYALAWTPWLMLESRNGDKWWKTGVIFAFLFLADPRWAVFAGLLWISYDIAHRQNIRGVTSLNYVKTGLVSFLIASPLILPMMEFARISTRSMMTVEDVLVYSLPPENLLGLIIPGSGGNPEWFMYPGGLLIVLFILQWFIKGLKKENNFWLVWIGLSLFISLGSWIPGAEWVAKLPLVGLLRVPSRALFISGIGFAAIGGKSIDWLIKHEISIKKIRSVTFGVLFFSILLGGAIVLINKTDIYRMLWGFVFLAFAAIGLFVISKIRNFEAVKWVAVGIVVIDLAGTGFLSYSIKSPMIIMDNNSVIDEYIDNETDMFRTYSPSYSIPQYLAVDRAFELADGVDPLQIGSYAEFMEAASGIPAEGYSVTIPPFKTGNPDIDNKGSIPDAFLLGLINVKYVVSEFEVQSDGLILLEKIADRYIYLNEQYLTRAWVQTEDLIPEDQQSHQLIEKASLLD